LRDEDIFARWGGEEFIFLLPETDGKQAFLFAKRLGQLISETPIKGNDTLVNITCSLGVTSSNTAHDSLEAMFQRAGQALYKAKRAGRNRAVLWKNKSKETFTP
jgi:diguanylate cyclase (GGDEF)-like protein